MSKPVDGKRPVPVILVHGWNGSTGTFTQPIDLFADGGDGGDGVKLPFSLTGQLENIPGLAIYNFDYSQYSNRWVNDSNIGPRLASAIECLTDFYGTKAEIIAHSMGGLAARFALDQKATKGPAIKDRVSQVVTFGTPNTGSAVAALAAKAIANGAASNLTRPNVASGVALAAWIITYICGRQMTHSTTDLTFPCDNLPSFITGFDSDAGQALRSGSPQLQALAAWPSTVHVTAVEGSTMFRGISLFGAGTDGPGINGGDVIVANDSASAGSGTVKDESCGFALAAGADGGDTFLQAFGPTLGAVKDGFIGHVFGKTNPCFHMNLLRTINGTNAAVGAVKPEAANASPIAGIKGTYTDRSPSDPVPGKRAAIVTITSVSKVSPSQTQTVIISGSGFGNQAPFNGDFPCIEVSDLTAGWNAGHGDPSYAPGTDTGASCGTAQESAVDLVTIRVTSWTDTAFTIAGFTGQYGNPYVLTSGDQVRFRVWNAQTGAGPASYTTTVQTTGSPY
ncbi:hypothetical protein [Arthrobacter sp. efr-133-TYG-118]|uniref:esterase/lipase family protein n=1 Tax=Arthrobacter sp. efr-133-TYG-118 TaxID=3040279 RepID=UPI00254EAE64|nr:hypothetical protein [Arthrobacter sp. efr-133-TYG-118]